VIIRVARASHETVRFGAVTTKRLGKAVQRNRARRLIREAMRMLCPRLQAGWDVVIIARPRLLEASAPQVQTVLEDLLRRAELFTGPPVEDGPSTGGPVL
jgi:ribonuclease P protein component